jgi:hypothetical protein
MRRDPAANAVQIFDMMLALFDGGKNWLRGQYEDGQGRYCLIAAAEFVATGLYHQNDSSAVLYLYQALPKGECEYYDQFFPKMPPHEAIAEFNDDSCTFRRVGSLILRARAMAQAELDTTRERHQIPKTITATASAKASSTPAIQTPTNIFSYRVR